MWSDIQNILLEEEKQNCVGGQKQWEEGGEERQGEELRNYITKLYNYN